MGRECCGPSFNPEPKQAQQRKVLRTVFVINILTFLMMLAASQRSGATSLLSGSLDNLGDALTYGLSLAVVAASVRAKALVAFFKAAVILIAALVVGAQIVAKIQHPMVPVANVMTVASVVNLAANGWCLLLLTPYRHADVNMSSAWECSRNDVVEGISVFLAALGVWAFGSGWPDVLIGALILFVFLRSALVVTVNAWKALKGSAS